MLSDRTSLKQRQDIERAIDEFVQGDELRKSMTQDDLFIHLVCECCAHCEEMSAIEALEFAERLYRRVSGAVAT